MVGVLRRNPSFAVVWLAQIVSGLGDELLALAFPFYVFSVTGSVTATGAAFVAASLAGAVVSPIAGVIVDQVNRRTVMVASSAFSGCAVLGMLLADGDRLWLAYVSVFLLECGARFFAPARTAATPSLVSDDDLLAANGLASSASSLTALVGPALGGVLFAAAGLLLVVVLDAVSFFAAAVLAASIRLEGSADPVGTQSRRPLRRLRHDFVDGLKYTMTNDVIRPLLLIAVIFAAAIGALNAIAVPFAQDVLQVSAAGYGLLLTAEGVGGVLAGVFMPTIAPRVAPRGLVALGLAVDALCIASLLWLRSPWLVALSLAAAGAATVIALASVQTLVHRTVPDGKLGRVGGITAPVIATGSITAILAATAAADAFGVLVVLSAIAAVMALAATLATAWARAEPSIPRESRTKAGQAITDVTTNPRITLACRDCDAAFTVTASIETVEAHEALPTVCCPNRHANHYAVRQEHAGSVTRAK